jgi:hypothetical protein
LHIRLVIFDARGPAGFLLLLWDWSQPGVDWTIYDRSTHKCGQA